MSSRFSRFLVAIAAIGSLAPAPSLALPAPAAVLETGVPLYRFFRGFRKPDLAPADYIADLQTRFIPAAPATHAKNGLVAYLPAVPPADKPSFVPDEFAVIAYENAEVYQTARNTPEGQAYTALHWEVFDKDRSKSGSTTPFAGTVKADTPYDVLGRPTDWLEGVSTFYVGLRRKDVAPERFQARMADHVALVERSFGQDGLEGYLFVTTPDYEAAYQNWSSQIAMDGAFASPAGKAVAADAGSLMTTLVWSPAGPFEGKVTWGMVFNSRFARRSPRN